MQEWRKNFVSGIIEDEKLVNCLISAIFFLIPLISYKNEFFWSKLFVFNLIVLIAFLLSPQIIFPKFSRFLWAGVIFLFYSGLSFFWAANNYKVLEIGRLYLSNIGLYLLLCNNLRKDNIHRILKYSFWSAVILSLYGIFQYLELFPIPIDLYGEKNAGATFNRTNQAAQYLITVLPFALVYYCSSSQKNRLLLFGTTAIFLFFLITKSRSAWMGFFFSLILFCLGIFFKKEKFRRELWVFLKKKIFVLFGAFLVVLLLIIFFTSWGRESSVKLGKTINLSDTSIKFRLLTYASIEKMIKDHPFLGVGLGNLEIILPYYQVEELERMEFKGRERINYAHNDYLQIWAELGSVGLVVFLVTIVFVWQNIWKALKGADDPESYLFVWALSGGIMATLMAIVFDYNLYFPVPTMQLVLLISGLELINRDREGMDFDINKKRIFKRKSVLIMVLIIGGSNMIYSAKRCLAEIYTSEGDFYARNVSPKEAIKFYSQSINLSPDQAQAYYGRGVLNLRFDKRTEAIDDLKEFLKYYPADALGHYQLGLAFLRNGDLPAGQQEIKRAELLSPSLAERLKNENTRD